MRGIAMPTESTCSTCGAALPTGATQGLCPRCLMGAALGDSSESPVPLRTQTTPSHAVTTPQPGGFVPPQPHELAAGFPQLEILELLGHGGMGAVYKARQKKLDRFVAVKILRPESAHDPAFAERFNREARTLARLNHPHIVGVHDFGEIETVPTTGGESAAPLYYFLMEYVDGNSLRDVIHSRALRQEEALDVVSQVCDALQYAHDQGVVHRDIKPENILIDRFGRVKIADFGLAKLVVGETADFTLTATHQVMGTPKYMAPEQMQGSHAVDHRADIYSLGVVLYEMLTGEVPLGYFELPSKKANVDARLDQIVLKTLAREPDRRYQSVSELKLAVGQISSVPAETDPGSPTVVAGRPARGMSTIMEREVDKLWRWFGPAEETPAPRAESLPIGFMLLLSVLGIASLFFPWVTVHVPEFAFDHVLSGVDLENGITSACLLGGFSLFLIAISGIRGTRYWQSTLMTLLSVLALVWVLLVSTEVNQMSYQHDGVFKYYGNISDGKVFQLAYYVCVAAAIGLVLFSAVSFRHATLHARIVAASALHAARASDNASAGFIRRETQALIRWLSAPGADKSERPAAMPLAVLLPLWLVGAGFAFVPWVQVDGTDLSRWHILSGFDLWPGILVASGFVFLIFYALAFASREAVSVVSASVMTVTALIVLIGLIAYPSIVRDVSFPLSNGMPVRLRDITHSVNFGPGYFGAIACALVSLMMSAAAFRHVASPRSAAADTRRDASPEEIEELVLSVLRKNKIEAIRLYRELTGASLSVAKAVVEELADRHKIETPGIDQQSRQVQFIVATAVLLGVVALVLSFGFFGGPLWIVLAIGVYVAFIVAIAAGSRSGAKPVSSPSSPVEVDPGAVQTEIDGPSLALMIVGVLTMIGHAITIGICLSNPFDDDMAVIGVPGLLTGLGMFVGGLNLRNFWSRGWSQMGVIAGFIPVSPGWLLSLPIGIWAWRALSRPYVVAEFTVQARIRREQSEARNIPPFSGKAILGTCWAALVIFAPLTFIAFEKPDRDWPAAWQLVMLSTVGIPGAIAPFATTILGWLALSDIKHAQGRLRGRGLAFFDAVIFPTLFFNALIFGLLTASIVGQFFRGSIDPAIPILISAPVIFLVDVLVLRWLWRTVAVDERTVSVESPRPAAPLDDTPRVSMRHRGSRGMGPFWGTVLLLLGAVMVAGVVWWALPIGGTQRGPSALLVATQEGNHLLVRDLLKEGHDPNRRTPGYQQALWWAAYLGDVKITQELLLKGAQANAPSENNITPLMLAALGGHTDVVRLLLEARADPTARDTLGKDPIHYIAVDLDGVNEYRWPQGGQTALTLAVYGGHADVVRILLENGADPGVTDAAGQNVMQIAEERGNTEIIGLLWRYASGEVGPADRVTRPLEAVRE